MPENIKMPKMPRIPKVPKVPKTERAGGERGGGKCTRCSHSVTATYTKTNGNAEGSDRRRRILLMS